MIKEEHFKTTSLDADLVDELLPQFLDEMSSEFQDLLDSFNRNDLENVKSIAHRMRGTAQVFGAYCIEENAEQIENFIIEDEGITLLEYIEELKLTVKKINQEFEDAIKKSSKYIFTA